MIRRLSPHAPALSHRCRLAASCGLPTDDDSAEVITDVSYGLLETSTTSTSTTAAPVNLGPFDLTLVLHFFQ